MVAYLLDNLNCSTWTVLENVREYRSTNQNDFATI